MTRLPVLVAVIHTALAIASVCHVLLFKRHSRSAIAWITAILLYPIAGPVAYGLFGVNRIRTTSRKLRKASKARRALLEAAAAAGAPPEEPEPEPASVVDLSSQPDGLSAHEWRMLRIGQNVSGAALHKGNAIQLLIDGDEAYPAMLAAIDAAQDRVWFTTYIFETNATGQRFIDALIAAKQRGVDVRVVLDGVGELYSWGRARKALRRGGVRVRRFLPPRLLPPQLYINLRNHRKLLCVDSSVGFAGGMNIGGRHMVLAPETREPTQDVHGRFEGPIVADLERLFLHDWRFITRRPHPWEPSPAMRTWDLEERKDQGFCRVMSDGPDQHLNQLEALYTSVISAAADTVTVVSPYFLPSDALIGALVGAAHRGVVATVVIPERSNQPYVDRATQRVLPRLLRQGVHVVRQPSPFAHTKLVAVDERYVVCGSANIDARSLRLNFEVGVEVVDSEFAAAVTRYLDEIVQRSTPLTDAELRARPLRKRLIDGVFWLASPYL